jgi:hypothetical protein
MWASLAISIMWLAVLFASVYGPSFVSSSGSNSTSIPSGLGVALFAYLGSISVAKYGLSKRET